MHEQYMIAKKIGLIAKFTIMNMSYTLSFSDTLRMSTNWQMNPEMIVRARCMGVRATILAKSPSEQTILRDLT